MPLNRAKGRMFRSVGWTWNPTFGCSHDCPYNCYARKIIEDYWHKPFDPPTFRPSWLNDTLPDDGSWIFVTSMGDLFCDGVDSTVILAVLEKIKAYAGSCRFLLQTKNPGRFGMGEIRATLNKLKDKVILGTTIETDELIGGGAPPTEERYRALYLMAKEGFDTFLSMEPIFDLDVMEIQGWIWDLRPLAVEIGRENYGKTFEPATDKQIQELTEYLTLMGIPYLLKDNVKHLGVKK